MALLLFIFGLEVIGAYLGLGVSVRPAMWLVLSVPGFLGLMAWKSRTEISAEGIRLVLWPERREELRWAQVIRVHYFEKELLDDRKRLKGLAPRLVLEGGQKPMELSLPIGEKAFAIAGFVSPDIFDEGLRGKLMTADDRYWVTQNTWVVLKARASSGVAFAALVLASPWAFLIFRKRLAIGLCMGAAVLAFYCVGKFSEPYWVKKYQEQPKLS